MDIQRKSTRGRRRRAWLTGLAVIMICLGLLGMVWPGGFWAEITRIAEPVADDLAGQAVLPMRPLAPQELGRGDEAAWLPARALAQSNRLFQGDLRVERGQVIAGDSVVYDGDVWIEPEGRITGNLVVFNGDVEIDPGGTVGGNVDLFSGDATVSGSINGNLALWSGDVKLRDGARVGGDINVLAGEIDREPEATVGGRVLEGPNLGLTPPQVPAPFGFGSRDGGPRAIDAAISGPLMIIQWVGMLLVRLLGAVLLTAFVAVLVGLTVHVRPDAVATVRQRMVDKTAMSFVVGLAANLILVFLGGMLAATVCLLPIALAPMLGLLAINLLGWAALSQMAGARLESYTLRPLESWMWAGAGAVLITSVFALMWAFGGVFRFMGGTLLLFIASVGAGAVLLPWVMRVLKPERSATAGGSVPRVVDAAPEMSARGEATYVAPVDFAAAPGVESGTVASTHVVDAPSTELNREVSTEPSSRDEDARQSDVAPSTGEDDFTQLKGVGPVIDGRLKDAGIRTYAQLAALSDAEIGEIVGWSATRVQRSEIVEQAEAAARDSRD